MNIVNINLRYIMVLFSFASARHTFAASEDTASIAKRQSCGDYSTLSDVNDQALFARHCGTYDEDDLTILRNLISRLDPKKEAEFAAQRGDFRLAALMHGGPTPPHQVSTWHTEGVNCKGLENKDVFVWLRLSDALTGPLSAFQGSMRKYSYHYNLAMLSQKSFPALTICSSTINN